MNSKVYALKMAKLIYGQADRLKMNRKEFQKEIECAHVGGTIGCLVSIVDLLKNNPDLSADEINGEIQLAYVEAANEMIKLRKIKLEKLSVDEMAEYMTESFIRSEK